jgi:transposase
MEAPLLVAAKSEIEETYSPEEAQRRFEALLWAVLTTPPMRLKDLPRRRPTARQEPEKAAARRGVESGERLGRHRWVIECTLAWFARFRRLTVRYERRADICEAFHLLAAGLICLRFVARWSC